ncbi:hypothetical protein MLD38_027955 [Melastoma candidum]|uniref:Uncharacterized protein n=1 Tax=Melastoma candidum TaxID=119954 RepID=A0ACB9N1V2_9MYRT|nr:hypothetical protein MLD38_027955 [Melastoma candidum]
MVAISLYRGNLHRVPDVPRRWLIPDRSLSMKSFKSLLNRRSRALSLVPNPNPNLGADIGRSGAGDGKFVVAKEGAGVPGEDATIASTRGGVKEDLLVEVKQEVPTAGVGKEEVSQGEKSQAAEIKIAQPVDEANVPINRERRKKVVEEKLQVLNEKKHSLVQVLKQILNAEEELKRRSSMQSRPPPPLQVDVGNESGSMNRQATPRIGSDVNLDLPCLNTILYHIPFEQTWNELHGILTFPSYLRAYSCFEGFKVAESMELAYRCPKSLKWLQADKHDWSTTGLYVQRDSSLKWMILRKTFSGKWRDGGVGDAPVAAPPDAFPGARQEESPESPTFFCLALSIIFNSTKFIPVINSIPSLNPKLYATNMAAPNPLSKHRRNLATPEPDPAPPSITTSDPVLNLRKKQYRPRLKQPPFEHPDPENPKAPSFLVHGKPDAHPQAKSINGYALFDPEKLSSLVRKQPQQQQEQGRHLKNGCAQEGGKFCGNEGVDIEVKLRRKFEEWEDLGKKLKEKEKVGALVVRGEELRKSCDGEVESSGVRRKATAAEPLIVSGGRRRSFGGVQVELSDVFATNGARVVSVDMPPFMQIHAVDCARKTSDSMEKFSCKTLALALKKEFDGVYGPAWHCIVGTSFGSFVTHSVGGFIYFAMDQKMYILLFKTTVQRAD